MIKCRISYGWIPSIAKYYCDTCGKYFDDKEHPPCGVYGLTEEQLNEIREKRNLGGDFGHE